jgi:signal transduction histidine kinase
MADITETSRAGPRTGAGTGLRVAIIGCLGGLTAIVLTLATTSYDGRAITVTADVLGVALPVGLGALRLLHHPEDRFARLLIGSGLLWSVATLSQSTDSLPYSVGRVALWFSEVVLVYLMLAFPYGKLTTRGERRVVAAAGVVLVVLFLPTVLFAEYPSPVPWGSCAASCPHNSFNLTSTTPAFVGDVVRPLRETLTILVFAAAALLLARRARRSGPLMRRALVPVVAIAIVRVTALGVYFLARNDDPNSGAAEVLGWIYLLSLPALTICFAAGLVGQRLFVASALQRLATGLEPHANARELRGALSSALADPTLTIVYWLPGDPGQWVDETGWPVKPPVAELGRAVTEVSSDGRPLAAIVHDIELSRDEALVRAATSYALTALENERLIRRLQLSMGELAESRARIVAVADEERRRIERDLHDGAQQRLVALRVKLELLAERLETELPEGAATIRKLEEDVDATIDEVRAFARGIYPSLLAERGLTEALRAVGRGAPIPTIVDAASVGRYAPEVEATVYFACVEALQNAAKHATGASGVTISLSHNGNLQFEVRDNGGGFEMNGNGHGAGLTNMRDRLAAVGGMLEVDSSPGHGTRVRGVIPEA